MLRHCSSWTSRHHCNLPCMPQPTVFERVRLSEGGIAWRLESSKFCRRWPSRDWDHRRNPLENYDLEVDASDPLGHRRIAPAETLRVNSGSGRIIEAYTPKSIAFRDGDHIRPVAPFLEVFVRASEDVLEP